MANHYEAACLSIDAVVTEVLINGTSPVSLKARELYDSAVAKNNEKKTLEAGRHDPGTNTHLERIYSFPPSVCVHSFSDQYFYLSLTGNYNCCGPANWTCVIIHVSIIDLL